MKRINHKIFGVMMALLPSLFLFSCEYSTQKETDQDQDSIVNPTPNAHQKTVQINADTLSKLITTLDNVVQSTSTINWENQNQSKKLFKKHFGICLDSLGVKKIAYGRAILDTINKDSTLIKEKKSRLSKWIIPEITNWINDCESGEEYDPTMDAIEAANGMATEASQKAETAGKNATEALNKYGELKQVTDSNKEQIQSLENKLDDKVGLIGVGVIGFIAIIISIVTTLFIANKLIDDAIKDSKDSKLSHKTPSSIPPQNHSNEIKSLTNSILKLERTINDLETKITKLESNKPQKTPPPTPLPPQNVSKQNVKKQEPESIIYEYLGNREGTKLYDCKKSQDGESLFKVYWISPDKSIGEIDIIDFDKVKYDEPVQKFVDVIGGCSFSSATNYELITKGKVKKSGDGWILDTPIKIKNINN